MRRAGPTADLRGVIFASRRAPREGAARRESRSQRRGRAVAVLGFLHIAGYPAWLAWLFIHLMYLVQFGNRVLTLVQWSWNYVTCNRSARLITGPSADFTIGSRIMRKACAYTCRNSHCAPTIHHIYMHGTKGAIECPKMKTGNVPEPKAEGEKPPM